MKLFKVLTTVGYAFKDLYIVLSEFSDGKGGELMAKFFQFDIETVGFDVAVEFEFSEIFEGERRANIIDVSVADGELLAVFEMVDKSLVEFGPVDKLIFDFEFHFMSGETLGEVFVGESEIRVDFADFDGLLGGNEHLSGILGRAELENALELLLRIAQPL